MCTVTWIRSADGYELFFNRDELLTRKEALPPRPHRAAGAAFLAPVDGDFGGSWLAVNEYGVSVGLLNGYRSADANEKREYRSRGLLLFEVAREASRDRVESEVAGRDLDAYRSFRLLVLAPEPPARILEWDGHDLVVDRNADGRVPLISSSYEESEVGRSRRSEFERLVGGTSRSEVDLAAYHRSHTNGPSAFSVCMHRPDAQTRSFSRVCVDAGSVSLFYHAGTPCAKAEEKTARLTRT